MTARQFVADAVGWLGILAGLVLGLMLSLDAGVPLLVIFAGVVFAAVIGLVIGSAFKWLEHR